jgi:hypothetical protein
LRFRRWTLGGVWDRIMAHVVAGILALHSARSLLVKQQTMPANAMRGLATEFGLTVPQGIGRLEELNLTKSH